MAKSIKVKSRTGRFVAGLVLVCAIGGLALVISAYTEQNSWASSEGTVQERLKSGKSASVKVEYSLPDGTKQTATLSENGPIRNPGDRVTVRYDLEDGRVVDAALADNDEALWVTGVMLGVLAVGSLGMNVLAWMPASRRE